MFDNDDDDDLYAMPCNAENCPFMRQQGPGYRPPQGPGGPPMGPGFGPSSGPGGGAAGGPPSGPPPKKIPKQNLAQQGIGVHAINPGAIRPCRNRFVYLWLDNGNEFWAWLNFVGSRSVSGWRWNGFRWVFFGIDLRRIAGFECF